MITKSAIWPMYVILGYFVVLLVISHNCDSWGIVFLLWLQVPSMSRLAVFGPCFCQAISTTAS